jgi:DNA repair exonuclease SbcCD ATPase subunit
MDEWTVKIVPQVVKKANDYGVRVMVVLTYPNYVWPDGPSQVPDADRARVLAKAQATLGVQSRDAFFFWPYLDASESRHVVKEATTAAILAGALERAIPRMDDRERAAKEARRKAAAEQERKLQEEAKQEEERRKAAAEQKKKQEEEAAKQEAERIQREAEAERLRAQAAKKEEERIQQEAKAESARVQAAKDMADEATRDAQRIRQEAEQALAELRAMQQRLMEQMKNATQDTVKSKQPPWGM